MQEGSSPKRIISGRHVVHSKEEDEDVHASPLRATSPFPTRDVVVKSLCLDNEVRFTGLEALEQLVTELLLARRRVVAVDRGNRVPGRPSTSSSFTALHSKEVSNSGVGYPLNCMEQ